MKRIQHDQNPETIPDRAAIADQLDRILAHELFQHSKRYPAFLRHVVDQTLRGATDEIKERILGVAIFKRSPDYDTSADPVVRNTASEVRKRLEEYYSQPGRQREIRIGLPVGGYIPEFRYSEPTSAPLQQELLGTHPSSSSAKSHGRAWVVAAFVLAVTVVGVAKLRPQKSALDRFWEPILGSSESVLVVTGSLHRRVNATTALSDVASPPTEPLDPQGYLYVSQQSAKLATFLHGYGKKPDYELARNVSLARLRASPFILRGAFNNQWTKRAVSSFRFYFQSDGEPRIGRIVDRQNPQRRDWLSPSGSGLTDDYALIAKAPEPETGQMMVVIAGLGEKGTAAALEFLTNPKYLERFSAQAPAGWEKRNLELVIQSKIVNGDWGEPHIVATHFW